MTAPSRNSTYQCEGRKDHPESLAQQRSGRLPGPRDSIAGGRRRGGSGYPRVMHSMRELWLRLEAVHAVTYFGDESREAARRSGLRGFWMGYFGFRASPLGPVDANTVASAFYNFAPRMIDRSIPDAWTFADPQDLVCTRAAGAAATLRRVGGPELERALASLPELQMAASAGIVADGGLCGPNRSLSIHSDPVEALWQACTTLREHRGDAHVQALRTAGVTGCESHLLIVAERQIPDEVLRDNRGWTNDEWNDRRESLLHRGLVGVDGALTDEGRSVRQRIEAETDHASQSCWDNIGQRVVANICEHIDPLAKAIVGSGTIPFPNPMGLSDVRA